MCTKEKMQRFHILLWFELVGSLGKQAEKRALEKKAKAVKKEEPGD